MPELPSFRFQPRFFNGGISRFHLPLLYDLVTLRQPARIVTLGYGDGQPHFTFCQALEEKKSRGHCLMIRRALPNESADDDEPWQDALAKSAASYRDFANLIVGDAVSIAAAQREPVDFLFCDDCDDYEMLKRELQAWIPRLVPDALVLFHGSILKRTTPPRRAFEELFAENSRTEFPDGIGLLVAAMSVEKKIQDPLQSRLFDPKQREELTAIYRAIASRISAEHRARLAEEKNLNRDLQNVWLDTVITDRWKAQEVMDEQMRQMTERAGAFSELHQNRVKAQLVMDTQSEQLRQWIAKNEALSGENKKLKVQIASDKKLIEAAKKSCRNRVRCFRITPEEAKKTKRSIPERIVRELRRLPRNLSRGKTAPSLETAAKKDEPIDRYAAWITEHEPDAASLDVQRRESASWPNRPVISLILPTYNPPSDFLQELISSVAAQTYPQFEICVADGGSDAATKERLQRWQAEDARVRVDFFPENFGIAENTNRALTLTAGEFFTCIDQDDRLAPFALYEVARAIIDQPAADIFYSDEDRLTTNDRRHAPFFKPEWNPEFLLSSMYLGHLTIYRRSLTNRIGAFRPEFDLSQDYDFALRATERARDVVHIPQVLYHWREHPSSGSAGGKPQARASNLAALDAAMQRRGLEAEIVEYPTANRARLTIVDWPRVSIIVPTDSPERARACIEQLPLTTAYPDYEIILVTNSSLADQLEATAQSQAPVRFVRYDKPFNFSDKCNLGAKAATGSRLVFFNDDVESGQPDWIQNLIEPLQNPEVGAVAPKLLYATGKIQHAGLVTGVRELVGTACHQWPGDSTDYTNFAQTMRDVSALSAACLAMRRDDFFAVGEFDATNTPIAHSDFDLCFKVRAAGMRCVYTPFATMRHRGHASLGEIVAPEKNTEHEKASLYLLKRWPHFVCHDPYFPENMRDWLYADSPTPIRIWAPENPAPPALESKRALLFVSHDLSWSGAPLILLEMARWCRARGFFIVVIAPNDGPLRDEFRKAGVPVIVDPLVQKGHESLGRFAREFDCVIASTIFSAPAVRAAKQAGAAHLWWIHEGRVAGHYLGENATLRLALREADLVVTPDTVSSRVFQPFTDRPIRVLPYGIADPARAQSRNAPRSPGPLNFLLLGTIEQRKGQRVLLEALTKLSADVLRAARFQIVGRAHELSIVDEVRAAAGKFPQLTCAESVSHDAALDLIRGADVVTSCSFDETGPLILMEALALGKPILSTTVGSIAECLTNEEGVYFFPPGDAEALAAAIARMVREPELVARLCDRARESYEKHFAYARFGEAFERLVQEAIAAPESGIAARA
ncbi:MAG TPA: glycosyltransferase [Chthoniobacterales bacterium]|jgi:GT2 family glycosyltransferase/glycosyltransferase involved in cell wall biosynthesis